jgi:predicted transcriptional regulator
MPEPTPSRGFSTSVRLDDPLRAQIDGFATATGISRTEAIRVLLAAALDQDVKQIVAREAIMRFTRMSRGFVKHLIGTIQASVPEAIAQIEREEAEL